MKGRRNTHGVAGIGGSGAPSPLTPAPSRRGVLGTIEGLPSSFTVASLPRRPRGTSSTRSAAKVPGRGAACHLRWRLRWGLAPVARAPLPGAGEDAPPTHAASAFSNKGPDKSKAGVGASRPFGPAWIDTVAKLLRLPLTATSTASRRRGLMKTKTLSRGPRALVVVAAEVHRYGLSRRLATRPLCKLLRALLDIF